MHGMQENVRQSNLQLVFLQTISLKGAMSRYFRVFQENLKLITSLKLENANDSEKMIRYDSEKKTTFIETICHNFENVGLTFSKITQT